MDLHDANFSGGLNAFEDLEKRRGHVLKMYGIPNITTDRVFDGFIRWLAEYSAVPIALISFVCGDQVAIKSSVGFEQSGLQRSESFCQHVIESDVPLVVPDATLDPRFKDSPLVTGSVGIRYYAGSPIVTPEGYRIGVICIADTKVRPDIGRQQIDTLETIARAVMRELESRRHMSNLIFHQELNAKIASAQNFKAALETVLALAGQRIGALYCLVPQQHEDERFYNFSAGIAIDLKFHEIISKVVGSERLKIADFSGSAVLTEQRMIDTGQLSESVLHHYTETGRAFFELGVRRQISVPLALGTRRAALLVGFERPHVSIAEKEFLRDLVDKLVPLLLGRLREEELSRRSLQMAHVNRAMRTLIGANQALASVASELDLIQTICEVAVSQGGYSAAWVGFAEQDSERSIRIVAKWGRDLDALGTLPLTWADTDFGRGASGAAIRENRLVAMHNIARDPRIDAFRYNPRATTTFGACVAVPLRQGTAAFGVFTLYNTARGENTDPDQLAFDREEEQLLTELARDIVNGINMIRDRDARNEALRQQRESDTKFNDLLASSPTILFALEHDGRNWRNVEITQNFERLTGYSAEDARVEGWWARHLHPEDLSGALDALRRVKTTLRETYQFRLADRRGGYRWIQTEMQLQPTSPGLPARITGAWSDVTEKREAQDEIYRLAFYDQLTGLPNRRLLKERLLKTVADTSREHHFAALLFVDLDRFKAINDAHGHAAGDRVLATVAQRLLGAVREEDTVSRLGGDEFVVLLPRLGETLETAIARATLIAKKTAAPLERPMRFKGLSLRVTASVGIYAFSGPGNMEQILRAADSAMYSAKASNKMNGPSGRSRISVFETEEVVTLEPRRRKSNGF